MKNGKILTAEEGRVVSERLRQAHDLMCDAYQVVRQKDKEGMSLLSQKISSECNDLSDTMDIVEDFVEASGNKNLAF